MVQRSSLWPLVLALLIGAGLIAPAAPVRAAAPLEVRLISQYTGLATQNYDCGPAAVAMLLAAYGKRPAGWTDRQLVQDVRAKTGGSGRTGFAQLEQALATYGLGYAEIPNTLAPQPDAQMAAIKAAVAQRKPVIALVHGATLGRGAQYGDHWLVVRGALLSFGYTLALHDVLAAIQITGLDPYLGTFHVIEAGRPSLALDLLEEFRPLIVDRLVLELVRTNALGPERFAQPRDRPGAIYLDQAGRALLVDRYEVALQQKVRLPTGEQTALRQVLLLQARAVARVVRGEQPQYSGYTPQ